MVSGDQIYRMETACQKAAEGFRQSSTVTILNTIGLDNAMNMLLQGISPDRIVQPVNDLLQQALQVLQQQKR